MTKSDSSRCRDEIRRDRKKKLLLFLVSIFHSSQQLSEEAGCVKVVGQNGGEDGRGGG